MSTYLPKSTSFVPAGTDLDAKLLRREHLENRYELASDLKNHVKCAQIKEIIKQEDQSNEWQRLKQASGNPCTGATNLVQWQEGDKIVDILEEGAIV